jgi:hypothetical protein
MIATAFGRTLRDTLSARAMAGTGAGSVTGEKRSWGTTVTGATNL